MKTWLLFGWLLVVAILAGCSDTDALSVEAGCTVTTVPEGYRVDCPGQEPMLVANGKDGEDGVDGRDGANGADGRDGVDGRDGADGQDGSNGQDGRDGSNGHSAVVAQLPAGEACAAGGIILLTAIDTNDNLVVDASDAQLQSATLCNGASAPVSPLSPVAIVDPCGSAPGILDEVFLRLANQRLVASFSDDVGGTNTRFAMLEPGSYITTDGDLCRFTVNASYAIVNESHHYDP